MVLVVAQHNLSKPCTDFGRTVVLTALKFSLDGFQLREQPLLSRDPPDGQRSGCELPTEVSETKKGEGFWLSLATLLSVSNSKPSELYQPCLVRM